MTLPKINYTPDILIVAVLSLIVVYGLVLGRNKVKTLALSAYVGLVIATELGAGFYQQLANRHFDFGGRLNLSSARLALFILPLIALELGRRDHHGRGGSRGGMVMTLILCLLTAALAVSTGLGLLDSGSLQHILGTSTLATAVYGLRLWWISLVPVVVVAENFIKPKDQ